MSRGRKPLPTALKLLRGNPGKRPLNKQEPVPVSGPIPECPDFLNDVAREKWNELAPQLYELGLLTILDRSALAALCWSWSIMVKASEHIAAEGLVVTGRNGARVANPWLKIERDAIRRLTASCAEFGMTPASRSRVHAVPPPSRDPFEDLLNS